MKDNERINKVFSLLSNVGAYRELYEDIHCCYMDMDNKKEIQKKKLCLKKRADTILINVKEVRETYGKRFNDFSNEDIITLAFLFFRTWDENLERLDSEKTIPMILRHNTGNLKSFIESLTNGVLSKYITLNWRKTYFNFEVRNEIQLRELFLK